MDVCSRFTAGKWKPNQCCNCFHKKEEHLATQTTTSLSSNIISPKPADPLLTPIINTSTRVIQHNPSNVTPLADVMKPNVSSIDPNTPSEKEKQQPQPDSTVSHSGESNMPSTNQDTTSQQQQEQFVTDFSNIISVTPSNELNSSTKKVPCWYGEKCSRKNPEHHEKYSHPPNDDTVSHSSELNMPSTSQSTKKIPCQYGSRCYRKNPDHFEQYSHPPKPEDDISIRVKLAEERFLASIADLEDRNKYLEEEIKKFNEEKMIMLTYHQQIENALKEEVNNRERHEIEKQRFLAIRRDTPSYWGINAFDESYRVINIASQSPEFTILSGLLNDTIETHGSKYGTIYKQDPTEFSVTQINRIHNKALWHEYCFKKESIIEKNKKQLVDCEGSKYLKDHPLLTPLLDANANEYWLFHGCDQQIIPLLLYVGYDPRVSSLDGMFGGGFYLAENSSKSNQYIPCPGCGKNAIFYGSGCTCKNQENLEFAIILYRVVLGDVHIAKKYDEKTYRGDEKKVRRPPTKENSINLYDSVMGESVKYGGNKLQFREFILYECGQAYPEYVIKFKRSAANARPPSDINRMKDKCYYFLKNRFNKMHE